MIRIISSAIGAAFVFVLAIALYGSIKGQITDPVKATAVDDFHLAPKEVELSSNGVFGTFDKRQLQRGLQVYKEVCSNCHSLSHVAFRDLKQLGYNDAQVKKFAADWQVKAQAFDEKSGDRSERPNVPSDYFPKVYYTSTGSPPDLSLITKARHEGPDYVHSLLTGYAKQPAALIEKYKDAKTPDGLYYNPYFANLNIAMPPPLTQDGQVQYLDGTRPTVDQMAKDVTAFLVWTAEPNLETRHVAGFATSIFLLIFCFLAWGAYQNVWRDVKH